MDGLDFTHTDAFGASPWQGRGSFRSIGDLPDLEQAHGARSAVINAALTNAAREKAGMVDGEGAFIPDPLALYGLADADGDELGGDFGGVVARFPRHLLGDPGALFPRRPVDRSDPCADFGPDIIGDVRGDRDIEAGERATSRVCFG